MKGFKAYLQKAAGENKDVIDKITSLFSKDVIDKITEIKGKPGDLATVLKYFPAGTKYKFKSGFNLLYVDFKEWEFELERSGGYYEFTIAWKWVGTIYHSINYRLEYDTYDSAE